MRTVLAGFAGGILMFVWASIAHLALPLGATGIKVLPNEAASIAAMASAMGQDEGLFIFPGPQQGDVSKATRGPAGFLVYRPNASFQMSPSQLAAEFAKEVAEALIAATLVSMAAISSFGARVGFVTLIGLAAAIATNASYLIWYGFPLTYTLAYGAIQLIGYAAAGLAIAWVVPPPRRAL